MQHAPELSAIVLGYRAGDSLLRVVAPLYDQLNEAGIDFELVIVANYWPDTGDRTPEIAAAFARGKDNVSIVARPKEGAMGWDMRSGLEAVHGTTLIVLDGDAQNPVEDVVTMFDLMKSTGYDVMKGRRTTRFDSLYRHVVSLAYNVLFRILFRTRGLWDINGKPKALTRSAYEQMNLVSDDWFIDAEIVLTARRLGLSVGEMPVVFRESERASFVRFSAIGEFIRNMTLYRLTGRR